MSKCPHSLVVQTLIFTKSLYEPHDVERWLREKGFSARRVEETGQSYRARQHDPSLFVKGSFRTISMGRGQSDVKAVVGCPIMSLWTQIQGERSDRKRLKAEAASRGEKLPPIRPTQPKLSPGWTRVASARRRAERRRIAAERGLPALAPRNEMARKLLASPPSPGTSLAEYARRQGLDLGDAAVKRAVKKAWKARRR